MTVDEPGMVIVGAGECGGRAAISLREHGWQGSITIIGEEPHPPYERPPLSKSFLTGEVPFRTNRDADRFKTLGVERLEARKVASIDRAARAVVTHDGTRVPYHRLLLATGSSARRVTVPGGEKAMCLRTSMDAIRIKKALLPGKRVAIIGGGLIGMELAASATVLGCQVTVVERQGRVLSRSAPSSLATIVEARHRSAGVTFILGTGVTAIEDRGMGPVIHLTSAQHLEVDMVIAGIGAVPNVTLAEQSGLAVGNGITTDKFLRTSDPAILAAGDCASTIHPLFRDRRLRLESWRNAIEQGERAARNMLGEEITQETVPWFWSDQYDLCLQVTGLVDVSIRTVERRLGQDTILNLHLDETGTLVAASGIGPLSLIAKDIRIAEMLITRGIRPDPTLLSQPGYRLKSLLAA